MTQEAKRLGEALTALLDELDDYEKWTLANGEKGGPSIDIADLAAARAELRALRDARAGLEDVLRRLEGIALAHSDGVGTDGHYDRGHECARHFVRDWECNCGADEHNAIIDEVIGPPS